MKIEKCQKCKTKVNRVVIERKTVKKRGREFIEECPAYKEYSCECGNSRTFGDLAEKDIDKENKFISYPNSNNPGEENGKTETE